MIVVIASAAGAGKHPNTRHTAVITKPTFASNQSRSQSPVALPNFAYPGDRHCAITYRARSNSAMTWTAIVTVTGQLMTHASDTNGNIYRHVVRVAPGPHVFVAHVALSQINNIGGVLHATGASYGCSVAPYRPGHRVARKPRPRPRHSMTPSPTPVAQPSTTASCYPLSNEGTCYEPGEFCRDSDHGATGLAGDGEKIVCEDNDGWRWEPA